MKLADRLKKCLQEVQRGTTSSEFTMWKVYMEQDINAFHPEYYYLAQIACEIRRVLSKHPNKFKTKDFLIKFQFAGQDKKPPTKEEIERRMALSKAYWFGAVGTKGALS